MKDKYNSHISTGWAPQRGKAQKQTQNKGFDKHVKEDQPKFPVLPFDQMLPTEFHLQRMYQMGSIWENLFDFAGASAEHFWF